MHLAAGAPTPTNTTAATPAADTPSAAPTPAAFRGGAPVERRYEEAEVVEMDEEDEEDGEQHYVDEDADSDDGPLVKDDDRVSSSGGNGGRRTASSRASAQQPSPSRKTKSLFSALAPREYWLGQWGFSLLCLPVTTTQDDLAHSVSTRSFPLFFALEHLFIVLLLALLTRFSLPSFLSGLWKSSTDGRIRRLS